MQRQAKKGLLSWRDKPGRKPLLVRGARQIGKTFLIREFGKSAFESVAEINFEEMKAIRGAFDGDLHPQLLLRDLSSSLNQPIIPGKTLLFLDEIQACPNALLSLRFFKEQMPDLHVIGAGSLLEFILKEERFSFPVGRVEYLFMRPMSFLEFLEAKKEMEALAWVREASLKEPIGAATHDKLIQAVKEYFIVGGMPEAVSYFIQTNQFLGLEPIHQNLLNTYENDFGKYPRSSQQKFMKLLFEAAPRLVAEHFKYAKIHPHAQSRDYLESLQVLTQTGILHQIFANRSSGVPLLAQKNEKKWKLLFLDIGLLPQASAALLSSENLIQVHSGKLAEQFVGQELVAYAPTYSKAPLYYWENEKRGSDAEVDYVIEIGPHVIPIEVKAGKEGSLRSLKQFLLEKKAPFGIRISQAPLSFENQVLSIPFYMISEIERLRGCL